MLRIINFVFIFLLVTVTFAQSQNHAVPGTMYAYVYNSETSEFLGWEGLDGTFVTPEGGFYDSVTYQGTSIFKSLFVFAVATHVETYKVLYFIGGSVNYLCDGSNLPPLQKSNVVDYSDKYPDVTFNPLEEDYPLPLSGTDENGDYTQRIFVHIFFDFDAIFVTLEEIDSYLSNKHVVGYVDGKYTYLGAGVSAEYLSYLRYYNSLSYGKAVVVTDKGEPVARDGFELLSISLLDKVDQSYIKSGVSDFSLFTFLSLSFDAYYLGSYVYQRRWYLTSYDMYAFVYGKCKKRLAKFYFRDQYLNYQNTSNLPNCTESIYNSGAGEVNSLLTYHKTVGNYEIWYIDRKYKAAGYNNNSGSEGVGGDGNLPTIPSPPSELSEFRYFSKDEDGKYHLKIEGVLNEFKQKLKDKYKFNFLGIDSNFNNDNDEGVVSDFQSGIVTSIEEVENAEPFFVEVEHRFDIVKGNFITPEIQVENTKLEFDFQKWFNVEILYVVRCIILFGLCIEFFFMTLKLFI